MSEQHIKRRWQTCATVGLVLVLVAYLMNAEPVTVLRIVAVVFALPLSALIVAAVRNGIKSGFGFPSPFLESFLGTLSALCWWFAIRGHIAEDRAILTSVLTWALIVGGISFSGGFIGPMIFMPKSNQGPLLGIFVTGPLGFIAGALVGLCIGIVRVFIP